MKFSIDPSIKKIPFYPKAALYGADAGWVLLSSNENPLSPSPRVVEGIVNALFDINRYPESESELKALVAQKHGLKPGNIIIGNGSNEIIEATLRTVRLAGKTKVIVPEPSFAFYPIASKVYGFEPISVPLDGLTINLDRMRERIDDQTRVVFLCNPNNPTGDFARIEEVQTLAEESGVAIVIDEAYFEYCGKSAIDLSDRLENIIICRTLSKAFSMAGVRIGYLVAKAETVSKLNAVRPPNSLSVISLILGQAALDHRDEMERNVRATVGEREKLLRRLSGIDGVEPYPTQTNFLLFRVVDGDAAAVHERLMRKGLVLRNLSKRKGVENCLRTTVSTSEVNERLASELESALARRSER